MSATVAPRALLQGIPAASFTSGVVLYRCLYALSSEAIYDLKFWVDTETPSALTTIAIGWGAAANTAETLIASETTAPSGVVFDSPRSSAQATGGGDLSAGHYRALWIRYTIAATTVIALEQFSLSYGTRITVPEVLTAPVISGSTVENATLTTSNGTWWWTPTSYAYQWEESSDGITSWASISGATGVTLSSPNVSKYIRARVIATNTIGASLASYSAVVGPVTSLVPTNSVPPVVTGTANEGDTLTTTSGTWSNSPTSYLYVWQMSINQTDWTTVGSGSTLVIDSSHVDKYIRSSVAGVNAIGSGTASTSNVVGPAVVGVPQNTASPTITGSAVEGETLTAVVGSWTRSPTSYTYQWQDSADGSIWANISGATASTRVLAFSQIAKYVRVSIVAANAGGTSVVAHSPAVGLVINGSLDFSIAFNSQYLILGFL